MRRLFARSCGLAVSLVFGCTLLLGAFSCGSPPKLVVSAPAHGLFSTAATVAVAGHVENVAPADAVVTVNGSPVTLGSDGSFSVDVTLVSADVLNPILVELFVPKNGFHTLDRRVVIAGPAVPDGLYSPDGIGMRINNTGLAQLQPTIQNLVSSSLDINALVLSANPIVSHYCVKVLICIGYVDVNATSASFSSFGIQLAAQSGSTNTTVTLNNFRVNYHVSGFASCDGNIQTTATVISGNYDQQPADPAKYLDVNQLGDVSVSFSGFSNNFTSGVCDFPLIGDLIQLVIGNIEPLVHQGFVSGLADPDGSGPADAPIAGAIQSTLASLDIAGPVGQGLGVQLDADFNAIAEDPDGLSYHVDARITQPNPTPGSPDLLASYHVIQPFPALGATAPVSGQPYGLGLAISPSAFNQLLKAEVESGLLRLDLTEFAGLPLTAGLLSAFVPEFAGLPADMPMTLRVRPTLAPLVTGNAGPGGELAEMRVGQLIVTVIGHDTTGTDIPFLELAFDVRLGLDFSFTNGALVPSFGQVNPADIAVVVTQNPLHVTTSTLVAFLPQVLALQLPDLSASLGTFPIPSFLGLQLSPVEISNTGGYLTLYVNLTPAP
jgi:hypothetical protein